MRLRTLSVMVTRVSMWTLLLILLMAAPVGAQTVSVNNLSGPVTVVAGTKVPLAVSDGPGNVYDWLGLYPVGAPDNAVQRVIYYFLSGSDTPPSAGLTAASFPTYVPVTTGQYEWRLYADNGWTRLATSGAITVVASPATLRVNGSTSAVTLAGGAAVVLTLQDGPGLPGDSVGVYRLGTPDTLVDWRPFNGTGVAPGVTSATLNFSMPVTPGSYEFRFLAEGGGILTRAAVTVTSSTTTVSVNSVAGPAPVTVVAGTKVSLSVANGPGNALDWVGLFPADTGDTGAARLTYEFLNGSGSPPTTGLTSATFSAYVPLTAGEYEWRMFADNGWTRVASSGVVTVTASPATFDLNGIASPAPVTVAGGAPVVVTLHNGPGLPEDAIQLYRLGSPDTFIDWGFFNNTGVAPGVTTAALTFVMPATPGTYEFRFWAEGGGVLTRRTLTVAPPPTTIAVNGAVGPTPVTVGAGTQVSLSVLNGPGNAADWVGLFPAAAGDTGAARLTYYFLSGTDSPPSSGLTSATFPTYAPVAAGNYQWRLFANNGWSRIATSGVISVSASAATISVNGVSTPLTVTPGSAFTAHIANGPGNPMDWVGFASGSAANNATIDWKFLSDSGYPPTPGVTSATLSFTAPTTPGTYELRFFFNNGFERLATSAAITVSNPLTTPTLSVASGTFGSEQVVVITSADAGVTLRYTQSGDDPTEADATIASGGTVTVTQSQVLKVRAFKSGAAPSAIASANYTLQVAAPAISPAAATYTTPQNVVIVTSTASATIRYTLDGSDPTASSALYSQALVIDATTTLRAKAFRSNWSDSALASETLTITPGTLSTPIASPPAGWIGPSQHVTLAADAGTVIRYTLNGSDPTTNSSIYASPITISGSGQTLKARAFKTNWTTSGVLSAAYTIDSTAPVITASVFPALLSGWMSVPVVVSFRCSDARGIASCSSPATLSTEGANQTVTGTAVDVAGNQATASVTVGLDLTAPTITMSSPSDGVITSDATIEVTGEVSDALSGVAWAACNGTTVTLVNGVATCTVPLRPGRNAIILSARDVAGHSSSAAVTVTRAGTASRISLAPATRTMVIEETSTLSLRDDFGVAVAGATWASSDPAIVSLSTDDPPVMTALASGEITITATKDSLTSEATITVATGTSLADGTTRWTVAPTPSLTMQWPIYTNRVDESVPDLFTVEKDPSIPAITVRAVTASGEVAWMAAAPGPPLMGDSFGGIVAGVSDDPTWDDADYYLGYARFAGPVGAAPWRYESPWIVGRPAQAPDGTIYAIETLPGGHDQEGHTIYDKHVLVLNGSTGQLIARIPLARERYDGPTNALGRQFGPATVGPIVGADGQGYVLVQQSTRVSTTGWYYPAHADGASDVGLRLLRLSPTGASTVDVIYTEHCTDVVSQANNCDVPPAPDQLVPDGLGGMLASATYSTVTTGYPVQRSYEKRVTRFDGEGGKADTVVPLDTNIEMTGDGATAYVYSDGAQQSVDVTTWMTNWTFAGYLVSALVENGVSVYDETTGGLKELDGSGAVVGSAMFGLVGAVQSRLGFWTGIDRSAETPTLATRLSLPLSEAHTSFMAAGAGSPPGQNSPRSLIYDDESTAARDALAFIYPASAYRGWEFGGLICQQGSKYLWSRFVTSESQSSVDTEALTTCAPYSLATARIHTHPPKESPEQSGFRCSACGQNDTTNADARPGLTFYLMAPKVDGHEPPIATHYLRYRMIAGVPSSRNNTFEFVNGIWATYPAPPQ